MIESQEDGGFQALVERMNPGSRVLRTWALHGGVSARVTAVEVLASDGETQTMVVRQYGEADVKRDRQIASHEYDLLQKLTYGGLPTPKPYYFNESNEFLSSPYVVVEFIAAKPDLEPDDASDYAVHSARVLSKIHSVDISKLDVSYLPLQDDLFRELIERKPSTLDDSLNEPRIRDVLKARWPLKSKNVPALLHGDFWPGNLLWDSKQLVSVIDWEDAAIGDPLADLANSRLEFLWAFGSEAMRTFTSAYTSRMPSVDLTDLPYWDLCAALRPISKIAGWGLHKEKEQLMREQHHRFVTQAITQISSR